MSARTDYDVIIVGTGLAGHCAALEAAAAGARILMLDSEAEVGGSTRLSEGVLMGAGSRYQREKGVEDAPELFLRHYVEVNGWQVQPPIARRFCYEAGPTLDWLEEQGVEFVDLISCGNEERPRGHVTAGGASLIATLGARLQRHDQLDTALETRVTRLLEEDGAIAGIAAGEDRVSARAVVVAAGGMGADPEMVRRWQPSAFAEAARPPRYLGAPGCRGDAVRFADQIGAQVLVGQGLCAPVWQFGGGYLPRYVLLVNALGHRFMDESWGYGPAESLFRSQPGAMGFAIFDDATRVAMASRADVEAEMEALPGYDALPAVFTSSSIQDLVARGLIIKAETLEQLAQSLALPPEQLLGTVERYNRFCANGFDEDFFKQARLRPVSSGPFYAFEMSMAGFALTSSGIRIDPSAQVIHRNSDPIPGLFAAGECTGGIIVSAYVGSGNALASASTFGRIAGRNAAAFALEGKAPAVDWTRYGLSAYRGPSEEIAEAGAHAVPVGGESF